LLFIGFSHPLILVATLILQTAPIFFIMYYSNDNLWNAFMLFLIFLGGLLIIFVYLAALVPNDILLRQKKIIILFSLAMLRVYPSIHILAYKIQFNRNILISNFRWNFLQRIILFILIYLLISLISVIFLCDKIKTPIKANTY